MRYRLERRDMVPQVPAWWNVGGTAFHECVREWETLTAAAPSGPPPATPDAQAERFPHHLAGAIAEEVLRHPGGVPMSQWRTGGRVSTQYPNKEDRHWWLDNGPEMVAKYVQAQEGRESEVLRIGGAGETLALELGFMLHLDGLPPIKGFVDQVLYFPRADAIVIRDFKSGSSTPVDTFQLKVYRLALERCFGVSAAKWWGDYWMARKGAPTRGLNLTDVDAVEREVRYRLTAMDTAESLGLYPPNPGNFCSSCGVREHCPAMSEAPSAYWQTPAPAVDAPTLSE